MLGLGRTLGDADDLWGDDTQSASIKGIFSIPIGNIAGRHGVTRADIELRRAKTQLRRLEENIIVAVRTSARNLESAQEGIEAAERSRIAAAEQLRAERIRLEQGESTPFDVLQREEVLVEAEVDKIRAVRGYRNSIVDLDREQGTILQDRNIVVDRVRPLR